ncbi:MAG: sensor histidine kinase [Bacteroidales bacterium]
MKISILQKLIAFSIIILVGNGILGYAVYVSNKKLRDSGQWVKQTEQIISLSGKILVHGIEIESASRGFVLTNDSIYLEPFTDAKQSLLGHLATLKKLVQDNYLQQQRVDSLQFYMIKRLDFSFNTIELRSKHGLNAAIALISIKQGKFYSDKMRYFIYAIQKEETELLHQRVIANENIADSFNKFTFGLFVLISVFTILLVIATGKNLIKDKEKEKRAAELVITNKELDFQFNEKEKQVAANKELEAFSYSVSHDLRAPLRHIGGFVDLLIKNSSAQLDATGLRYLNIISESAHEMGDLIDALLTFSRLSRTELVRTKIDSNVLVNQVFKTFSEEMTGRNIELKIAKLPEVMADETLIHQVWVNLISNALKYTRNNEKTVIEIGAETEKDKITFHIKDNGAGFDMKYADKLFGVFQRLHKARDFEGIGIGLANVNRIISRHGGVCSAESDPDKGATFFFSLPKHTRN